MKGLAWGARVGAAFRTRVSHIALQLGLEASWLMAVMDQESSLDPRAHNASGAAGLIQFMPSTCAALGTTTEAVLAMPAEEQLGLVFKYFAPWAGRIRSLGDCYGAVLWPGMIGKPDSFVVFDRADPAHPARYIQNKGLDFNADGRITRGEICARVQAKLDAGFKPGNIWQG